MRKSNFTDEQIAYALHQAEAGTQPAEICRKLGISEQTFYRWKRKYGGVGVVRRNEGTIELKWLGDGAGEGQMGNVGL